LKIDLVDLGAQYSTIKDEIQAGIAEILESQSFIGGEAVKNFEEHFAETSGVRHCLGVSNGTDAITLVLKALGVGAGDEVIVPVNTFIGTAEPVVHVGATPVFVDSEEDTYLIDPKKISEALTKNTKAIIPVHLYGQMARMDSICEIAKANNLFVIEDAAQAHLAKYKGKGPGEWGDAATFSFYPGKNLGAYGDAGAVLTRSEDLALKIKKLSNHGRVKKYDHDIIGYNNRLDALQAKILDIKLKYLKGWTESRRKHAEQYSRLLSGKPGLVLPAVLNDSVHVYHQYVVRNQSRDALLQKLQEKGVGASVHYPIPLNKLAAFKSNKSAERKFPVAERCAGEILSLPMYAELSSSQIEYVCSLI